MRFMVLLDGYRYAHRYDVRRIWQDVYILYMALADQEPNPAKSISYCDG
jgi:hypothetical protein